MYRTLWYGTLYPMALPPLSTAGGEHTRALLRRPWNKALRLLFLGFLVLSPCLQDIEESPGAPQRASAFQENLLNSAAVVPQPLAGLAAVPQEASRSFLHNSHLSLETVDTTEELDTHFFPVVFNSPYQRGELMQSERIWNRRVPGEKPHTFGEKSETFELRRLSRRRRKASTRSILASLPRTQRTREIQKKRRHRRFRTVLQKLQMLFICVAAALLGGLIIINNSHQIELLRETSWSLKHMRLFESLNI